MKLIIQRSLLLAIAAIVLLTGTVKAQDTGKEIAAFARKFQAAYNAQDDKALKLMHTKDAVRIAADGTTLNGNEAIAADLANAFANYKSTIEINITKTGNLANGSALATGTFHVKGSTTAGDIIDVKGSFTNTMVKIMGQWKLAKSVLASL